MIRVFAGVHILSTGGTAAKLRDLGCTVQDSQVMRHEAIEQ